MASGCSPAPGRHLSVAAIPSGGRGSCAPRPTWRHGAASTRSGWPTSGRKAGIVGSGIYRHFGSKDALLVALLDRVMDRLMSRAAQIIAASDDDHQCLSDLYCHATTYRGGIQL